MTNLNQLDTESFKSLVKDSIREVLPEMLRAERLELCKLLTPMISDAEQAEIEAELGTPTEIETEEFVDLTEWTENGGQLP